jgi:hypothetical protein
MTTSNLTNPTNPTRPLIVPACSSAVRSDQSDDPNVYAVCHHTGQYLTRTETNPQQRRPWYTQEEFPGIPALNRLFFGAAHTRDRQHLTWNPIVLLVLAGLYILAMGVAAWLLFLRLPHAGPGEEIAIYALVALAVATTGGLLWWGVGKVHQVRLGTAVRQRPTVRDFPLVNCTYKLKAHEEVTITPTADPAHLPMSSITRQAGRLTLEVAPSNDLVTLYQQYHQRNGSNGTGQFYAGILALEQMRAVQFDATALRNGHQLWLRQPIPTALRDRTYRKDADPLAMFELPYQLLPDKLEGDRYPESRRFPLECTPRLSSDDSYTLELHFRWRGSSDRLCALDECILHIPDWLTVERVGLGRYDEQCACVVWRRLFLPRDASPLVLKVTFGEPVLEFERILQQQHILRGSYRCSVDGLISGLSVKAENLWDARGLRVVYDTPPEVACSSAITGEVLVDTRRLQQEHEFVCVREVECPCAPDHELMQKILRALSECGIELLRVEQATPRLDPAGTLRKQLYYWDIVGRQYQTEMLTAFDLHIVVTGQDYIIDLSGEKPYTHIDIRINALHDPRDTSTPKRAEVLMARVSSHLDNALLLMP